MSMLIFILTSSASDCKYEHTHFMRKSSARGKSQAEPKGKRDANKEKTKEKILAAALELFRKKGLDGTTTRQISKKAGIAEGTLFNYFKTKEDLALFFFQKETHDLIKWFGQQAQLQRAPLPEQLFAIIHRQLEYTVQITLLH